MLRKIIKIDEEACNGCGLCVSACHEGAIALVNGKAKLTRDDYCDGLGDCLPSCPMNAISFQEKDTLAYDEAAVKQHMAARAGKQPGPGMLGSLQNQETALKNWPVQMKLMPQTAPQYEGAHLLIAADCTAFAYAEMHRDFMKGRVTVIGCPKLDAVDYAEKLSLIFKNHTIVSIHVILMEVPCCGGLSHMVHKALAQSGKSIPYQETVITTQGTLR